MKKLFIGLCVLVVVLACVFAALLLTPIKLAEPYRLTITKNQSYGQIVRTLEKDKVIRNRYVMLGTAYVLKAQTKLKPGMYRFKGQVSIWQIIKILRNEKPTQLAVTIVEGMTFAQFRQRVNRAEGLDIQTRKMSEAQILEAIGSPYKKAEGLFFPSTYMYDWGSTDLSIYKLAYSTMQKELNQAWEERQTNLPYQTPYELLTMASIVEKETAHPDDRNHVAAVFVNRLKIGMRLQTDPTVIYGMGDRYQGKLYRSEWKKDSPYNTYTRYGLTPTPISLPGKAALEAAAHPSGAEYLYFVSRADGTGLSQFSHTLNEHNAAVNKFIRKRKK
ncbi:endolytic transglycosylase MltG [Neisseria sp. Ec49-e6-T10]|uniref:endolytic transglycosylase MltG n=1 Tax=Neisseria sp. Ec49-e6-T10 TaxID=3140744 RepID=UPI003EBDFEC1